MSFSEKLFGSIYSWNRSFHGFFNFCMDQSGKIRRHHWKKSLKNVATLRSGIFMRFHQIALKLGNFTHFKALFWVLSTDFPELVHVKSWKKTWKGLLAGKGLMQSPWGSSPVGGLIQRVDFSGFIVLEGTWAQVRWPSMADGWYKWDCRLGHFRLNKQNNIGLFGTVFVSFWKKFTVTVNSVYC